MKSFFTLLVFLLCLQTAKSQTYVTIPDTNFVAWLQANVPSAMAGNQMDITHIDVKTRTILLLSSEGISDLTGIEYFDSLKLLSCYDNSLLFLPPLPNSIISLNCSSNQLTNLPTLPNSLKTLLCTNNQLTNLPTLPNSLKTLICSNNQISTLPNLPSSLLTLICANNNIYCFPYIPNSIVSLTIKPNPFICLPNYIPSMDSILSTYPLCQSNDTVGCPVVAGISGYTYKDLDSNCIYNSNDLKLTNIPILLFDNNSNLLKQTISFLNGDYSLSNSSGIYNVVIDTLNMPYKVQCNNPGNDSLVILTNTIPFVDNVNFSISCKSGIDVGVRSVINSGNVFAGQNHTMTINAGDLSHWYNLNCANGVSGIVSFTVSGPVTFVSPVAGALTPTVIGNMFTYAVNDFGTINNTNDFNLIFKTDTNAQTWDMICVNVNVTANVNDINPINNMYQHCYYVRNSYDPNIKEVYPVEVQQGFNDWLTYTIRFQNTGNASAINIRLEDQLDNMLSPETFQVINYSHNNLIDLTGNHLIVRFPNIQLADSTSNPDGSIGFIQYRIKPKASWVTDTIKNSAEIFFDFNLPIVTNTVKSYFVTTIGINELTTNNAITLLPNPTNGIVTINSKFDIQQVEIINLAGQILLQENVNDKTYQLQLQSFADGIYFVKVSYPNGLSTTKKIVVNH